MPMVADSREKTAYSHIAEHYRFVLSTLFECLRYPRVIILEARAQAEWNRLHAVFVFCENISFLILQSTAELASYGARVRLAERTGCAHTIKLALSNTFHRCFWRGIAGKGPP